MGVHLKDAPDCLPSRLDEYYRRDIELFGYQF
jgi:hypothetical protein